MKLKVFFLKPLLNNRAVIFGITIKEEINNIIKIHDQQIFNTNSIEKHKEQIIKEKEEA